MNRSMENVRRGFERRLVGKREFISPIYRGNRKNYKISDRKDDLEEWLKENSLGINSEGTYEFIGLNGVKCYIITEVEMIKGKSNERTREIIIDGEEYIRKVKIEFMPNRQIPEELMRGLESREYVLRD